MTFSSQRLRAAAAVLRLHSEEILLVKHRWHDGTASWVLPGGALVPEENPEEAALRELYEETGLKGRILRFLFSLPYDLGSSTTFLVEVDPDAQVALGYDPEEMQEEQKMLEDVAWLSLQDVREHPEVRQVLACIPCPGFEHHEE
jgi:8-oxo-dGTP diphosphatase